MSEILISDKQQQGLKIRVRGQVQGVGFRPAVWHHAKRYELLGDVKNDGEGVLIRVWGTYENINHFKFALEQQPPPLAKILSIDITELDQPAPVNSFEIIASQPGSISTLITPDTATCQDCVNDIKDPTNARYFYPFTNCTHCGPRLSIINALPYDRGNTSMSKFEMCADCREEYQNPLDRRFHAQPNACDSCGPHLWLETAKGKRLITESDKDAIDQAAKQIQEGAIVAVKGIGGFHLACDATNELAVSTLRARKKRYDKPFALMAVDLEMVESYTSMVPLECDALLHKAAPIVVLNKTSSIQADLPPIAPSVAPGQSSLGFMLPYTPLHYSLMGMINKPLILTSGNLSHEPQIIDNEHARRDLCEIADFLLFHDRDIVNRLDDSVIRHMAGDMSLLRRARGFTPSPINLPDGFEKASDILAMGGELKNTFCLLKNGQAILSQHIGDLEDPVSNQDYRQTLNLYQDLFEFSPQQIAVDLHPDYLSTRLGQDLATDHKIQLMGIQHHHAHIAACLAENDIPLATEKVLGIALDGLGLGSDGELWGGEFLLADYRDYQRLAHFAPLSLIGGARAMTEPWRNTYAAISTFLSWDQVAHDYPRLDIVQFLRSRPLVQLDAMMAKGINVPLSTSAGRLFDAVAAALRICPEQISYEGQAAIELEALAEQENDHESRYGYEIIAGAPAIINWQALWQGLLADLSSGICSPLIARRFHNCLIAAISEMARLISQQHSLTTVALSGGVFQNRILLEGIISKLEQDSLKVLHHKQVPANDGGLALGQAVIAAARQH